MILDDIVKDKRKRLIEAKRQVSPEEMRRRALAETRTPVSFYEARAKPGLSIIGEFKKAAPSLGKIPQTMELTDRISEYNESVDAISCLTEEDHFLGSADYLRQIRAISPLPILRKDFTVDEYQIYEARVIGADAILLIAAILDDADLRRFYELAASLGLDALVEVHNEEEMERALALSPRILGVNNRNLKDFSISLETTRRLAAMVPAGQVLIAESGIMGDEDVAYLGDCGISGFLIGRAFMESENPRTLARHWKSVFNNGTGG
ncbi:MAG: indole-3-glycerol phosphate synthase TrpC [Lachnospiraceae bacterium]|nr:indole-3-glycerol phosphate synthase TrpC [Lachnospiraceae bacterium]